MIVVVNQTEESREQTEEGRELLEMTHSSGTQEIHTWVAAEYANGWKVVGAADTYGVGMNPADVDYSIQLISLNAETGNLCLLVLTWYRWRREAPLPMMSIG